MGTDYKVKVYGKEYTPEEVSAKYYARSRRTQRPIWQILWMSVITVPAYFNDNQRQATKDAALSPGSTFEGSSTSPQQRHLPTGWTRRASQDHGL